jgi:hypothetical protein
MEAQETRSALSSAGKMRMKFSLFVGTGLMPRGILVVANKQH